jgi:prevent-host-death family protein
MYLNWRRGPDSPTSPDVSRPQTKAAPGSPSGSRFDFLELGLSDTAGRSARYWTNLLAKEAAMSDAAAQFNIHDAKTNLSRIIDRVEHGEEIIISRAGTPVAKVIPLNRSVDRVGRGSLAGRLTMTDDWDSPEVNEAITRDFGLA